MKLISENKIRQELMNFSDEAMTLELAKRQEKVNFNNPFDGLKDKQMLRTHTIIKTELTNNHIHPRSEIFR